MDSCIRSVLMTPFPALRDTSTALRPRLFAGLLAHRAQDERRISRYWMLCRLEREAERAFISTISSDRLQFSHPARVRRQCILLRLACNEEPEVALVMRRLDV
jgi:hypothetical protein